MADKLSGILIPKVNKKAKMHADFYPNHPIGGGGGTSNYEELDNLPQINGITLEGNKTATQLGLGVPTPVETTMPNDGFLPNILYNLGEISNDTEFILATPTDNTIANIYCWTFSTGSSAPTITWPSLTWNTGTAPTINASKHYEISVLDGYAICAVF